MTAGVTKKGGVKGKITGVEKPLTNFLEELGKHLGITIEVSSGLRDKMEQANAMYDRWCTKLKKNGICGGIYGTQTLPTKDRDKLTEHYNNSKDLKKKPKERSDAKVEFIKLAKTTKSTHLLGKAVDVTRASVPMNSKCFKIMKKNLRHASEKKNETIWHFDTRGKTLPTINEATKKQWDTVV